MEFGLSGNEDFLGYPTSYQIIGGVDEADTDSYSVDYCVTGDWGSGFTGTITVTNNTEETIEDWVLEFDFDNEITSIWDGEITAHDDVHYVVHNTQYNKDINAGESITVGFVVNEGNSANLIFNVALYSYSDQLIEDAEEPEREKEPLQSIGEAYFKAPSKEDVTINEETGVMYVKNQVLISAYMGVEKSIIEEIAEEIDAEIVGYIELTNDYQLEFREEKSAEEIDVILGYLNSFSFVSLASLNVAGEWSSEATTTNDKLYNDNQICGKKELDEDQDGKGDGVFRTTYDVCEDDWNEDVPDGDNWGLETLKVLSAWDYKDTFQPVRVGVYDNMFGEHEDLVFDDIYNNPNEIIDGHGTHVAGIIAATHNNEKGISGVATDVRLYGYANQGSEYGSSMRDKHAYATLVGNHVKVINVSLGMQVEVQYAASHGNVKAINYVKESAKVLEEYLNKLVMSGDDFLIVTSAGNTENISFVKDNSVDYGYREYDYENDKGAKTYSGGVEAYFDCALTAIEEPNIKNRIIVVGSARHRVLTYKVDYFYSDFSNIGDRVDVCAPGEDVLSVVPKHLQTTGYQLMGGTSVASPCVAGIAALMYQANPSINAVTVKEKICNSGTITVRNAPTYGNIMPDAFVCCIAARNCKDTESDDVKYPSGIITGCVKNQSNDMVSDVKITALKKDTGEYNLGKYCFDFYTDADGYYMQVLPQGTYDLVVCAEGYLPFSVKSVTILPDNTKYMENLVLSKWVTGIYRGIGVKGTVIDALKGTAVENATVKLRTGWNNKSGAYAKNIAGLDCCATTDVNGEFFVLSNLGTYTIEISREGYITEYYNVVAGDAGGLSALTQTTMVLTPVLPDNEYRMVLTWGKEPIDLDSHLTYSIGNTRKFHVYFNMRSASVNDIQVAKLDLDQTNGYGPETITMTVNEELLENGVFRYCVHDYVARNDSTARGLSISNAQVRVYKGNNCVETYNVPSNKSGSIWHVFTLDKNGMTSSGEVYGGYTNQVR